MRSHAARAVGTRAYKPYMVARTAQEGQAVVRWGQSAG